MQEKESIMGLRKGETNLSRSHHLTSFSRASTVTLGTDLSILSTNLSFLLLIPCEDSYPVRITIKIQLFSIKEQLFFLLLLPCADSYPVRIMYERTVVFPVTFPKSVVEHTVLLLFWCLCVVFLVLGCCHGNAFIHQLPEKQFINCT